MDTKVLDEDESAELPYIDDSIQFGRLFKVIEDGKLTEVLQLTDKDHAD